MDRVPGFSLMPGDEILGSISAMMDNIRLATGATGVVFSTATNDGFRVEVCRAVPKLFFPGDILIDLGDRSKPHRASDGLAKESQYLESEHFSVGPIRCDISMSVFSRVGAGRLTIFTNRRFSVDEEVVRAMLRIVAIHIETSLGLRSELEGISHRLNDAEDRAYRDSLTGLLNRHGFASEIHREQARRDRHANPVTVVVFDLDGLKEINDQRGHEVGDRYLAQFAKVLANASRSIDAVARLGGDEFAILAPQTNQAAAEAMRLRYERILADAGVSASMGFATDEETTTTISDLVILADAKMYQQKRRRKAQRTSSSTLVG